AQDGERSQPDRLDAGFGVALPAVFPATFPAVLPADSGRWEGRWGVTPQERRGECGGLDWTLTLVLGPCCEMAELKTFEGHRGHLKIPFVLGAEFLNRCADDGEQFVLIFLSTRDPKDEVILIGVQVAHMARDNFLPVALR